MAFKWRRHKKRRFYVGAIAATHRRDPHIAGPQVMQKIIEMGG